MKTSAFSDLLTSSALLLLFPASLLTAADVPGSKDPLGLKRYEGTTITYYDVQSYEAYTLPLGKMTELNLDTHKGKFEKSEKLEGKLTRVSYMGTPGRSSLEVLRNYEAELKAKGWETLWQGTEDELSQGGGFLFGGLFAGRPGQTFEYSFKGSHFLAAKKENAHLAMYVTTFADGYVGKEELTPQKGAPIIAIDIVESAAMDEKMVVVKADEMASRIGSQGSVNLYGFYFDFNSATLKPESQPTIDEVVTLLQAAPALRVLVVGHTDAVGTFDYNIDLSKKRAAAVVAALTARVPGASGRLTPCGVGYQCPIATNEAEEGRAKNRRVALVKVEK